MTNQESLDTQAIDVILELAHAAYRDDCLDCLEEARIEIERLIAEHELIVAEKIIAYLDDRHFESSGTRNPNSDDIDIDKLYKGLKNNIRSLFEQDYGYDPTPRYPLKRRFNDSQSQSKEADD